MQAQGQGELSLLLAEAMHDNTFRGLAKWRRPMAQAELPDQRADHQANDEQRRTLETLAQTLTTEELLDLPLGTILRRLFHETSPDLAAAMDLHFACTCNREKVEVMLQSLGTAELQSLLDEQGGADVCCEFCRHNQHFDVDELKALMAAGSSD